MAVEAEQAKADLQRKLSSQQAQATSLPKRKMAASVKAVTQAAGAVVLDEADTRMLIDE